MKTFSVTIDENRNCILDEDMQTALVQWDHNITGIVFTCPRYWADIDLSTMDSMCINYLTKNRVEDTYVCKGVTVDATDANLVHFTWVISDIATQAAGILAFTACSEKVTDEDVVLRWNSQLCSNLNVLKANKRADDDTEEEYSDLIASMLARIEALEDGGGGGGGGTSIDDTSTTSTKKTWSAKKIYTEISTLSEEIVEYPSFVEKWQVGVDYETGKRVNYNDDLYKVLQPHTSTAEWNPVDAISLYARVLAGQDGTEIGEWEQPDSTNPYMKGDKTIHNGKTWVSTVDNNVWEPGVYGWTEATD